MLPSSMPTLTSTRLTLRAFTMRDAPLIQSVATDPLIPLITSVPTDQDIEEAQAFITRQHQRLPSGSGYSFAIAENSTDEAMGQIGLWLQNLHHGRASTGYWIAPQYRRRGYMSEALSLLSQWALAFPEISRLELYVEPWNQGSWNAAEACGFQREGLLRSWQKVGENRKDMYMYGRIAE